MFTFIDHGVRTGEIPMRGVHTARFGYIYNAWADGEAQFVNEAQNGLTMAAMIRAAQSDPLVAARTRHFLFRTREELYDYESDPWARQNLIDDPRYRDDVARLRHVLLDQMESTGDPLLDQFLRDVPAVDERR